MFYFWLLVANPYPLLLCEVVFFDVSQWCAVSLVIGVHRLNCTSLSGCLTVSSMHFKKQKDRIRK